MKYFITVLTIVVLSLSLLGCGGGGSGSSNPVAPAESSNATLTFNFISSGGNQAPINSLRAAPTDLEVIFEVHLVQPGNTSTPVAPIKKTVKVVNQQAEVTFNALPLNPAFCKVQIVGGTKDGHAKWRGALQLAAGNNSVDVAPEGSKDKEDLMAGVLEALTQNITEFQKIDAAVISKIQAVVEKLVGTNITDEMAMMAFANPNPAPIEVPAAKSVEAPLAQPVEKLKVAVKESLVTALDGFRTSSRASAIGNPIPENTPFIGSNNQVSVGAMLQFLPNLLPGGTSAINMPINDDIAGDATDTLLIEYTPTSIKYKKINRTIKYNWNVYPYGYDVATKSIKVYTVNGINVVNSDAYDTDGNLLGNYISGITSADGWSITQEEYDPVSEALMNRFILTQKSGLNFDINYQFTAEKGISKFKKIYWYNFSDTEGWYEVDHYGKALQTTSLHFSQNIDLSAQFYEPGKDLSNFELKISGLSGKYSYNQNHLFGRLAIALYNSDSGEKINSWYVINEYSPFEIETKFPVPVTVAEITELPTFINNNLTVSASGNYIAEGFELSNLNVSLNNIAKKAETPEGQIADYSFSDANGSLGIKYTGNEPAKYGYIYMLQVAFSGLSSNSINNGINDGAQFVVTKTNTDNTNNVLTYKIVNGKPVLQPVEQTFTGGSETVSTDGSTTTIQGSVTVSGNDSTTVSMGYQTTKTTAGDIAVKVDMTVGSTMQTIYFSRSSAGVVTGRFYLQQKTADDSQNLLGDFSIQPSGAGSINFATGSGYSGTTYFSMTL